MDPAGYIPVEHMLAAYGRGMFPMCHDDGNLYWHDPDPRAIFPMDRVVPNARMRRLMRSGRFTVRMDRDFTAVLRACAERPETWIDERIVATYEALHRAGHAHSVEAWADGRLVGGVYGVALGGAFFAESMFNHVPNAGKVAFHALVEYLLERGYSLLDTQYINDFTRQLGAMEVPRAEFRRSLARALQSPVTFF